MQKNIKPFTESQIELLRGNYATIADNHDVDRSYVSRIASGNRSVSSKKSKKILEDLQKIVNLLELISA